MNAAIGFFICIENHSKSGNRDFFLPVFDQLLITQTILVSVYRTNGKGRYLSWKIPLPINILKSHYTEV